MGLDMYLTKEIYVGAKWEHRNVNGTVFVTVQGKQLPIKFNQISIIEESAMYWRKANHIHKWFVDNVQDGEDNCKEYFVSIEKLIALRDTCKKVLANRELASELLPTQEGFFFGGTAYDEYYFSDTEYTLKELNKIIREYKSLDDDVKGTISFIYSSSW